MALRQYKSEEKSTSNWMPEPALGKHAAILLDVIAEIRLQLIIEDHQRLTEQRAVLRPADIEHIAQLGHLP
ncbi:MAG: hypothetical protein V8T10_10150 [Merdibacter sp.]